MDLSEKMEYEKFKKSRFFSFYKLSCKKLKHLKTRRDYLTRYIKQKINLSGTQINMVLMNTKFFNSR